MISLGSKVCWINSEKCSLIFSLLKFKVLLAGSASFSLGGMLSRLPPDGGRSSAHEETINNPAGIKLGAISNRVNRNNANSSNETVINRDFPVFEITILFLVRLIDPYAPSRQLYQKAKPH